jgi:transposase
MASDAELIGWSLADDQRLWSLLELGDLGAELAVAYRVKERLRDFYRTRDVDEARRLLEELVDHCTRRTMLPGIQKLGRTLPAWIDKIANSHLARVSNGPTQALNNSIKEASGSAWGSATSRTTGYVPCSTPADATGASWARWAVSPTRQNPKSR